MRIILQRTLQRLASHSKDFGVYPKSDGNPMKDFEQGKWRDQIFILERFEGFIVEVGRSMKKLLQLATDS